MVLEQIIAIIIIVLLAVFAWAIFKKLFTILFYVGIILSLIFAVNFFFVFQDFRDLRENFQVSEKKVILKDGDKVLTGLLLNGATIPMTNQQLSEYTSFLEENNYEKILDDSYKLMIFDVDIISNLDGEVEYLGKDITGDEAVFILRGSGSKEEKASLFSILLSDEILNSRNPLFFFSEFKNDNIIIYPKTALFKTIKFIPLTFFENAGKKIFEKTKETAKVFAEE